MKNKNQTLEEIAEAIAHNNNRYVIRHELLGLYVATVNYFYRQEQKEKSKLMTDICP